MKTENTHAGTESSRPEIIEHAALALKLPYCEFSHYDLNSEDYPDIAED